MDIIDVLGTGPQPNPDLDTGTRRNEELLGIDTPCVYAYLGRTIEAFGKRALALHQQAIEGQVSPFDTGGLVLRIHPVCDGTDAAKTNYLHDNSWESHQLPDLLNAYPGAAVGEYLDGRRPSMDGPHSCLPVNGTNEDIWSDPRNSWQSWTWEGRSETRLQVGNQLMAWTCQPDEFSMLLLELSDSLSDDRAQELGIGTLLDKYHPGGVSSLVAGHHGLQEVPHA